MQYFAEIFPSGAELPFSENLPKTSREKEGFFSFPAGKYVLTLVH